MQSLFDLPIQFEVTRYRFYFQLEDELYLPDYAGSTLRGVFGQALKKLACLQMKLNKSLKYTDVDCKTCQFNRQCAYPVLFESNPIYFEENKNNILYYNQKIETISNPYIIDPLNFDQTVNHHKRVYQAGELFSFDFSLIGKAQESLAFVIFAWQKAFAEQGLTKKQVKGQLVFVEQLDLNNNPENNKIIYDLRDQTNAEMPEIQPHEATRLALEKKSAPENITIYFQTPLRIISQRELVVPKTMTIPMLMTSMIRRVFLISQYYWLNSEKIINDFNPQHYFLMLSEQINQFESVDKQLEFYTWQRYSNRQKQSMNLWGVLGQWTIKGDFSNIYPFLQLIEHIHLGKNTSFGLGKIKIS